jgi:hypothetical protein
VLCQVPVRRSYLVGGDVMSLVRDVRYDIVQGPGKYDWIQHFTNKAHRDAEIMKVTIRDGHRNRSYPLIVNSLQLEDGSCNNFMFTGNLIIEGTWHPVYGFYSPNKSRGWIKLEQHPY